MITYNTDFFNGLLEKYHINFLNDLQNKQQQVKQDIKLANLKKKKIVKKLTNNDINLSSQTPKEFREYTNTSEFSFKSIEKLIENLTNLQLHYNDIEKDMIIILEIYNLNSTEDELKDAINILVKKISLTIFYEKAIEIDNEKYNLLIDSFLNNLNNEKNIVKGNNIKIENLKDNLILKISEKEQKIELPYTKGEIEKFLEMYPNDYKTPEDVIFKEFTTDISTYNKHPILARFREAYYLSRNKEMKSIIDSFIFAKNMMFKFDINPIIISAVKSQKQLDDYIDCLENNTLENFSHFAIIFEVNPL